MSALAAWICALYAIHILGSCQSLRLIQRDLCKTPICGAFLRCALLARLPNLTLCLHSLCCCALNCIHIWRFCKGLTAFFEAPSTDARPKTPQDVPSCGVFLSKCKPAIPPSPSLATDPGGSTALMTGCRMRPRPAVCCRRTPTPTGCRFASTTATGGLRRPPVPHTRCPAQC